ncbi:hypothetical protein AB0L63_27125 [Nocardia sp. NPDC051990]|uniref:hypothetical protein n=1 Tax=Nocardia sp. NPDC051990 TaxID=3155285 RepID=UPI003413D660
MTRTKMIFTKGDANGHSHFHEITRSSIVDHYGTPAIKSTKEKHDPNLPPNRWITAPVAEAVVIAE